MSMFNYVFSSDLSPDLTYDLIAFSHSKFENDWVSLEHQHPYCEILFIISGSGFYVQNNHKIPLKRGDLVIINTNVPHTELSSYDNPLEYAVFSLNKLFFSNEMNVEVSSLALDPANTFLPLLYFDFSPHYQFFMDNIALFEQELHNKKQYYQAFLRNLFNNLLITILRHTRLMESPVYDYIPNKNMRIPSLVSEYIQKYYSSNLTLEILSNHFFINKYYLIHSFKSVFKTTPIQYLNKVRIEKAKILLETTDFSITDISGMVGFNSPAYFTKLFKRQTQQTPSAISR